MASCQRGAEKAGLAPITPAAKEGLALLNGTQASTAFALRGLFEAEDLFASAVVCGALTTEAVLGSRRPFDARIHEVRGQRGQIDAAAMYRHVLTDTSEIADSHHNCEKVQDPYSLRCQPQVMGACLTQLRQAAEVLLIEANAVSDNPLVFARKTRWSPAVTSTPSRWRWRRIISPGHCRNWRVVRTPYRADDG